MLYQFCIRKWCGLADIKGWKIDAEPNLNPTSMLTKADVQSGTFYVSGKVEQRIGKLKG